MNKPVRSHNDCEKEGVIYFPEVGHTKEVCKNCKHYHSWYGDTCMKRNTFLPSDVCVCKDWERKE